MIMKKKTIEKINPHPTIRFNNIDNVNERTFLNGVKGFLKWNVLTITIN